MPFAGKAKGNPPRVLLFCVFYVELGPWRITLFVVSQDYSKSFPSTPKFRVGLPTGSIAVLRFAGASYQCL